MTPAFQPDDRASAPRPEATPSPAGPSPAGPSAATPSPAPAEPTPDLGVLKQVLDETMNATAASAAARADLAALRAVALSLPGEPFGLSVAIELISTALAGQFSQREIAADSLRPVATRIATTLCDDPVSRARLEALWERLCERSA